ncbi:hypothetical protein [Halotia branconii]|uniref:Uncharacterized protein n=1 Tax=Halotia branconii CENA392 TaxID=1539056 RepID=A0AAJ6P9F5_9CYAN|nr:hypothetical protein [Halotia branconii]WGV25632.1 hypothetical protein QI031_28580 [Halotia branconii CENA392]
MSRQICVAAKAPSPAAIAQIANGKYSRLRSPTHPIGNFSSH